MFTLENDTLRISIASKGAELQSIYHKGFELEYMWDANPKFWAKRSPVLFPIVGALKEHTYRYGGKEYQLPRHGFARERVFSVERQAGNTITLSIQHDEASLKVYPFHFHFYIRYALVEHTIAVTYGVWNKGDEPMYFSVGGHPAFKLPLVNGTAYDDYELRFNKKETTGRWPIIGDGLIQTSSKPLLQDSGTLPLSKDLFQQDAVVLKQLQSDTVTLRSDKTEHGIDFHFPGFPYLGLWAAPGADFLCIEPWCGIADSVESNGNLEHKEGIQTLASEALFEVTWQARFF